LLAFARTPRPARAPSRSVKWLESSLYRVSELVRAVMSRRSKIPL
jgi:hypothetical protein